MTYSFHPFKPNAVKFFKSNCRILVRTPAFKAVEGEQSDRSIDGGAAAER